MILHHIGRSEYRPDSIVGPACWPHFDLLVTLRGSFIFDLPQVDLKLYAGDAVIIPKDLRFCCQSGEFGGTISVHHFSPGEAGREHWIRNLPKIQLTYYAGGAEGTWAQALLERIHELHVVPAYKGEQAVLFKLLLDQIQRSSTTKKPSAIQQAIQAGAERQWRGVDIHWMAQQTGWSESHFRAKFLEETGKSIGDFLKVQRLEWARQMLHATDVPIKQIGQETGYTGISAFYNAFRDYIGCPPGEYRERHPRVV